MGSAARSTRALGPAEPPRHGRRALSQRAAVISGSAGVVGVASLGLFRNAEVRDWVARLAMLALAAAVVCASIWVRRLGSTLATAPPRGWTGTAIAVAPALIAAVAAQSWFTWGRSVAGGDIAPPEGTARYPRTQAPALADALADLRHDVWADRFSGTTTLGDLNPQVRPDLLEELALAA